MKKHRNVREQAPKNILINSDYIAYLMLIPAILPIIYIFLADNELMTFSGGSYILTCLILVVLFTVKHKVFIQNQDNLCFSKKALIIFFGGTFFSIAYTIVGKYLSFRLNAGDSRIFMSMIRGEWANFGYAYSAGFYHLARHQNYILFLLSIIYFIFFKSMIAVLLCYAAAITAAGVILYKITRLYFNQLIALVVAFTFLSSPLHAAISWFYPEIFYTLAITLLFYLCITNKHWLYLFLAACFLLCIKEDSIFYMPGFLWLLWHKKRPWPAALLATLTIAIALFNILVVAPYFAHKNVLLGLNIPNIASIYFPSEFGHGYKEIVLHIITHPLAFILHCFDSASGFWPNYGYWLFLPLLSPFVLLSSILSILLNGSVKSNLDMHAMVNYYSTGIGVIAFIGMITVFKQMIAWRPKHKHVLQSILLFLMLTHYLLSINYQALAEIMSFNQPQAPTLSSLMRMPMRFLWWRAFYKIDTKDITDASNMGNYLEQNYPNTPICMDSGIYNNLAGYDIHSIVQSEFHANNDFYGTPEVLSQNKCVIVFAYDPSGFLPSLLSTTDQSALNVLLQSSKCTNFGNFYACDNL